MLLHAPFEKQAARDPEAIAVRLGGRSLGYGELNRRAELLARDLRRRGVGPDGVVGVCAERSFELVTALLGVLKAGAAYLPLDPSYPRRRLLETLDDARPAVLLADAAGRGAISSREVPQLVDLERVTEFSPGSAAPALADRREPHPDELAYVIYTSGSSGRPKGVMCAHRGIDNRLRWMQERYRLTPGDRVLHKTSIGFDVSVWELFWPLRVGAQLVLANPGEQRDPDALGETMRARGVTIAHFVPAMLAAFASSGQLDRAGSLRAVFCSGEALPPGLRDRFFAHSGAELHNLYGPTEASVDVTHHACSRGDEGPSVPIGRAIDGVRVEVLDEQLRPVEPGVEGEICISGAALARGYLGRPGPTASAFVPDPLGDGSRLYRSGDRGRLLAGGEIEFLGRRDGQVKIRGVRIELGEVESAMASLPGVERAAAALAGEGAARRLVGCVTGPCGSPEQLRRELGERLPEQAVPAAVVRLDSLPTLPNGKTDRGALAGLVPGHEKPAAGGSPESARATPEEAALGRIWREVLSLPEVAAGDNFFSLGGDSIRSIEVVARARAVGMRLSTSDVFAHPTLRDLARRGKAADAGREAPSRDAFALVAPRDRALLPVDVVDALPLSSLLAGLVAESFDNPGYMVYTTTLGIEGRFDRAALEAAASALVGRHPVLRSAIEVESFGEPLQLVYGSIAVPVAEVDARGLSPGAWERSFGEWLERERRTPFDWGRPPLVRLTAHRRGEDLWQLTMSEPFLDGWSAAVVLAELLRAYRDGAERAFVDLAPPRVSNRELVVAEREARDSTEHRDFWAQRLAGAPPTRLPRLAEVGGGSGRQRRVPVPIPAEVSRGLVSLAKDLDVPLKSVLFASHARTMAALSGEDEVVCGLMVNGRSEEPDGERAVGLFLNTLPVRLPVGEGSWADLARAAYAAEAEILPWRRYPYARILRDRGGQHLFDSVFNFTHFRPYAEFEPGSAVRVRSVEGSDQTYFPITAQFGIDPLGGGVELVLELNEDRFADLQVEQLVDLHAEAAAEMTRSPGAPHSRGSLIGPRERSVRAGWTAPRDRPADRATRLEDLFDRRAEASPERIAVFDERERLSFDQVRAGAGRIASQLRARCGGREPRRVGICMERRPAVLGAMLATLRLGAAFVPLDCELPGPRLRAILLDADVDAVIADARGALAIFAAAASDLTGPLVRVDVPRRRGRRTEERVGGASAESPAYVLYTSGSTGQPKGVVGSHRALVNRLRWMWDAHPFAAGEVCCVRGSLGFVDSVTSLFGGVLAGVPTFVLADERQEPDAIAHALGEAGVTRLTIVPALLQALLAGCGEEGRRRLGEVDHWVLSGEPLSGDLVDRLRRLAPRATVLNLYGSTEVAGDVTAHECRGGEEGIVPVGTAVDAMRVRVVDRWGREAPCGAQGEVTVEGPGLAGGYLGDPRMTAERFRPSPDGQGAREFRTGDLGRRRFDGGLEICGRADRQVKVNGVRVEPAEVEAALASHPLVAGCGVVAPRADVAGSAGLVAFVELADAAGAGGGAAARELRDYLRGRLPSPMVPGRVVVERALPRTASGKIDRSALATRAVEAGEPGGERGPVTSREELIAAVWADELGVADVGAEEDFFALGGDSLTAVRVLARLTRELEVDFSLRDLFDHPTVRGLACRGEAVRSVDRDPAVPP